MKILPETSKAGGGGGGSVNSVTATDTTIVVAGTATDPTVGAGVIVAPATHAATSKATPVDADEMPLADSAASFGIKKLTWANLKATVKAALTSADVGLGNVTNDAQLKASQLDTDGTLAANSDTKVASQKATKTYVDAVAQGLSPKASVRVASAAALPANTYLAGVITITATGVLTVDGKTVALNDRLLVKDEAAQANNGIYLCTTAGAVGVQGVLTRATDSDTGAKILGGYVFVEDGTANAAAGFVNTNTSAPTIGTTAITYTQFSGAGEITAGTGLAKSGNTLSVAAGGITSTEIADGAIVNADVNASAAIVYSKLSLAAAIANSDLATMAAKTVKMRHTNSTGAPEDTSMANLLSDLSGQAAASFAMNSQKLTGLAAAAAAGDAVRYEQVGILVGGPGIGATLTGSTSETAMSTIAIPAGMIGANGIVVVEFSVERPASETSSTNYRVRFGATGAGTGGTVISTVTAQSVTQLSGRVRFEFYNFNNAAVQHAFGGTGVVPYTMSTTAATTAAINTANASEVCITAQLGTTTDHANVYAVRVTVYSAA